MQEPESRIEERGTYSAVGGKTTAHDVEEAVADVGGGKEDKEGNGPIEEGSSGDRKDTVGSSQGALPATNIKNQDMHEDSDADGPIKCLNCARDIVFAHGSSAGAGGVLRTESVASDTRRVDVASGEKALLGKDNAGSASHLAQGGETVDNGTNDENTQHQLPAEGKTGTENNDPSSIGGNNNKKVGKQVKSEDDDTFVMLTGSSFKFNSKTSTRHKIVEQLTKIIDECRSQFENLELNGEGSDMGSRDGSGTSEKQSRDTQSAKVNEEIVPPLCKTCYKYLTKIVESNLKNIQDSKEIYTKYLQKLKEEEKNSKYFITETEIQAACEKEKRARAQLEQLQEERKQLDDELKNVQQDLDELERLNEEYWREVNDFQLTLDDSKDAKSQVDQELEYVTSQLDKLKKTNVYNDAFRIWHHESFGTINGFRLGRLSTEKVENEEINIALGYSVLLLSIIADKLQFSFQGYRLLPKGSFSQIEVANVQGKTGPKIYDLYMYHRAMILNNQAKFQRGLQGFVDCIEQLGEYAERHDPKFRLPYRIENGKIEGIAPYKLNSFADASSQHLADWTKVMKYLLIDLKWLLAFCCTNGKSKT